MTYRIHVTLSNDGGPLACETVEHADEDQAAKLAGWVVERMVRFGISDSYDWSVRNINDRAEPPLLTASGKYDEEEEV